MIKKITIFVIIAVVLLGIWFFVPGVQDFLTIKRNNNDNNIAPSNEELTNSTDNTELAQEPATEVQEGLTFDEYLAKGNDYSSQGFLTLASNNFSAAVDLNPQSKEAQMKLIETFIALRDFTSAEATTKKALTELDNDQDLILLLGEILLQKSEFDEAKKVFSDLPDDLEEKYFYLGALMAFENNHAEAREMLAKAKNSKMKLRADIILQAYNDYDLFPDSNPLHLQLLLAEAFNKLELYEMAIKSTKDILKQNEKYRDAWLVLGHSYLSLEKYDFAKSAFLQGLEFDPTKPETSYFLGLTEEELGNYTSAMDYMDKALLNGHEPRISVLRKLGDYNTQQENYSKAIDYYEEALKISQGDVNDFVRPVWILIDYLDQPQKALEFAKMAVDKHGNSAMAYNLLGWAHSANKDKDNAEKAFAKAIELDPNLAAIYLNMGKLYEQEEEYEKALEYYKKAYEMEHNTSVGLTAASSYNRIIQNAGIAEQ